MLFLPCACLTTGGAPGIAVTLAILAASVKTILQPGVDCKGRMRAAASPNGCSATVRRVAARATR